jgi:hypothetical protein
MGEAKRRMAAGIATVKTPLPLPLRFVSEISEDLPSGYFEAADRLYSLGKANRPSWTHLTMDEIARAYTMCSNLGECLEAIRRELQDNHIPKRYSFAVSFRASKAMFRFESALAKELRSTRPEGKLDPEVLKRMPHTGVWIEAPNGVEGDSFAFGASLRLSHDNRTMLLDLSRLHAQGKRLKLDGATLRLDGRTLDDAIAQCLVENMTFSKKTISEDAIEALRSFIYQAVACVLHLCADEPGISSEPVKVIRPEGNMERLLGVGPAREWDVAVRNAGYFRTTRCEASDWKGGTHARPRPHVRRAHYQTVWTGPGRDVPKRVWVAECLVATSSPERLVAAVKSVAP